MNKPFNKLTDGEAERIAILMEECAEVIKTCGKILRHGYESFDPTGAEEGINRQQLEREIGDIEAIIDLMLRAGDTHINSISEAYCKKTIKFQNKAYLHHQ